MSKLKTIDYTLPEFWACYLINGDDSGLSNNDVRQIDQFMANEGLGHPLCCSDDNGDFRTYHDARPYGVLACDCLTYTFEVQS